MKTKNKLSLLPAVDSVLQTDTINALITVHGHTKTVDAIRSVIEKYRQELKSKKSKASPVSAEVVADEVKSVLSTQDKPLLKKAINATGIILHTGLGRAVMPDEAREALCSVTGFCNLQTDLESGKRAQREDNIVDIVCQLTGAEDVALVNNNAGATMLVLSALAKGKEVVVSRGEMIEIGGSFRLPDIMAESGALLKEIGTTNKTHAADYEKAIGANTAMLLKAHKSNYDIVGFTKDVGINEIAAIGRKHKVLVVDDLGCGALIPMENFGMDHEVTVSESIKAGSDIVLFSTDKLIGGPQGGLIVGKKDLVAKIRKHPLYRVLRVCKLTLAALEATLKLFKSPELLTSRHPIYRMIGKKEDIIKAQADSVAASIKKERSKWKVSVSKEVAYLGGGSLPSATLPTYAVVIEAEKLSAQDLALKLRSANVPVIPRISDDKVFLDMRTVDETEIKDILNAVKEI